jgi:hypothetical protein
MAAFRAPLAALARKYGIGFSGRRLFCLPDAFHLLKAADDSLGGRLRKFPLQELI